MTRRIALQLDGDVGDHEGDRLAVGDRLAERLALLDVGRDVVEHRLRRCRPPARTTRGARAARTRRTRCRRCRRAARSARPDVREEQARQPGGAHAHRRVGLDRRARRRRTRRGRAPGCRRAWPPTTNSSASAPRTTADFTPSRTKPSPVAQGRGRERRSGSKSTVGSASARRGRHGDLVAGERGQVGRCCASVPQSPMAVATAPGARAATARPMSPLRQGLGDEGAGHRPSARRDAAELLGHAEDRAGRSPGRRP